MRAMIGLVLACCISAVAQDKGNWRAESPTAKSTTGDVALFDEKLAINFSTFTIAPIRSLEKGEVSAVFDVDSTAGGSGSLYRLNIPGAKKFLHKNSLCGSEDGHLRVGPLVADCVFFRRETACLYAGSDLEFNGPVRHVFLCAVSF
jgi:hypothetical protein